MQLIPLELPNPITAALSGADAHGLEQLGWRLHTSTREQIVLEKPVRALPDGCWVSSAAMTLTLLNNEIVQLKWTTAKSTVKELVTLDRLVERIWDLVLNHEKESASK